MDGGRDEWAMRNSECEDTEDIERIATCVTLSRSKSVISRIAWDHQKVQTSSYNINKY